MTQPSNSQQWRFAPGDTCNVWRYINDATEEKRLGLALGGRSQGCCETSCQSLGQLSHPWQRTGPKCEDENLWPTLRNSTCTHKTKTPLLSANYVYWLCNLSTWLSQTPVPKSLFLCFLLGCSPRVALWAVEAKGSSSTLAQTSAAHMPPPTWCWAAGVPTALTYHNSLSFSNY